jgi:hypothetical protein
MNVRNFEIHDVVVVNKKFGLATTKTFKIEVLNIHNLLIQGIRRMDFIWIGTKNLRRIILVCCL